MNWLFMCGILCGAAGFICSSIFINLGFIGRIGYAAAWFGTRGRAPLQVGAVILYAASQDISSKAHPARGLAREGDVRLI